MNIKFISACFGR